MGRIARGLTGYEAYHLTTRGANKRDIFKDDIDRRRFIARLGDIALRAPWSCLGYCLMSNHVHLIIRGDGPTIGRGMRDLLGGHSRWFNTRHERTGPLFGGRYHHVHIASTEQMLTALQYVARNPVKAGLVNRAEAWRWSSYSALISGVIHPGTIDLDGLRQILAGPRTPIATVAARLQAIVEGDSHPPVTVTGG